jgi:hypothetical protein
MRLPGNLVATCGLLLAVLRLHAESVVFNRNIRPILSDTCFHCHGPDKNARKAGLRLDIREEALKPAESGDIPIVPGRPEASEVAKRVLTDDSDDLMPPPKAHKPLSPQQKELIRRWIAEGAVYQKHWSYEAPVKAPVPARQNGVDEMVRKRLAEIGLKSAPEADRRILIRRLCFDLLGLPPTPEEVAAFVNDKSPDAYERLVDRLLQNPHYGERMAMGWLDVVRFADTIGYHSDNPHNVWPYRDWVIRSFNDNKRFDRFTLEQIAGDLLPDASQQTRIGSAFNRLLLTTQEGGAQPKDYEARMVTDRVRAVGAAWLGQTTGCAQCHDHKFDPFTTRDFYSLGAFFADIEEKSAGLREEGMMVATPEQEKRLAQLDADLAAAKKKFDAVLPALIAAQREWEEAARGVTVSELQPGSKASAQEKKTAQQVADILKKDAKARKTKESEALQDYFRTKVTKLHATERDALAKAEGALKKFRDPLPRVLVSTSMANKRTVRILPRGNWMDETGEVMKAALPHYLPQPRIEGREPTRLDLAQWVVSRENPLTARTVMNRLWKQFFGTGLSKVLDDLGAQGEPPVNPALLDWLACEFMDSGWDMKHMVRTIVTSHTYRQASSIADFGFGIADSAERQSAIRNLQSAIERDPYNREHARQSRFRIDAELVRDNALAIGGLLVPKIGGPSVKPYQPDRYWENLAFPAREYVADKGESQYRRGLYTWWQRSFLHPSLLAFDAPSREECTAERNRSNIPQQALVLLNDPTYVEAARAFAARILGECHGGTAQRLTWAWQQALQRDPSPEETKTMLALLDSHLAVYRRDTKAAEDLLKTGLAPASATLDKAELAAWSHIARVLLNLHETITRS